MDLELPAGFTDLLQEFTVQVLQEKPDDIIEFAASYFMKLKLKEKRSKDGSKGKSKGVNFQGGEMNGDGSSDDEEDEDFEPPKNRYARRQSVCAEPLNPDSDEDENPIVYPKTDDQRLRLNEAIRNILLFKNVAPEQLSEVLDAMFEKKVQPGDHVIDQGDDGDNFYVIDSGVYEIYVKIDGKDKMVSVKGRFVSNSLSNRYLVFSNNYIYLTVALYLQQDRNTFRRILLKAAAKKRKVHEALLESVPMLKEITEYERMNLADALQSRKFKDGECVIQQGDEADCMYFVESGVASIRIRKQDDPTQEVELTQCSKGGYFGELALVTHKPRAASVYSVGNLVCAVLDVHAFERLLGPCMDILKRNIDGYEEQLDKLGISHAELR
ncbi:PREDICTED: cAMP-dependent protein kinase type II regulatory subunit-like [Acropora digitifera]|uniref:cAMP-dependent protein kinase type II regulatory subunit-like n=1 Tax=Acropora digitifera TaxID=70779 RepID=UPI000779F3A6|nr:PREDICTED: cAMP-dependent protein kinase type II regulatory subunit-like [Acropora digitifera]